MFGVISFLADNYKFGMSDCWGVELVLILLEFMTLWMYFCYDNKELWDNQLKSSVESILIIVGVR